jgi:8-oxo-dGTP diphosphatase
VWRERAGHLDVLLVHRPRYRDWSWPKGKLEPGEAAVVAAVREVGEETGQAVILGRPLPTVRYRISRGRSKTVYYWAARVAVAGGGKGQGDTAALKARPPITRADAREVDQVRWVEAARARRRLTKRKDRAPLDALTEMWREGTLETRSVIVQRHASAVSRKAWPGDEASRPLTGTGREMAAASTGLLSAFGVGQVWTSPWRRCRKTVRPYARAAGVPRRNIPEVSEAAAREDPAGAARTLRRALAAGVGTVLCTHRPVLPVLFSVLRSAVRPGRAARAVRRAIPTADPYLHPSELLVVHVAARRDPTGGPVAQDVVAVERQSPSPR